MSRFAKLAVVLVALAGLAGCATQEALQGARNKEGLTYLEAASRYLDLANEVEARIARGDAANATLLGPLCIAYSNLKRYSALFECADRLDARIRAGDTHMKGDFAFAGDSEAAPMPDMVRAQAWLELGEYARSIEAGRHAMAVVPASGLFETAVWPPIKYQLTILTNLAIAAALADDAKLAAQYRTQLEDFATGWVGSAMWRPMRTNGLARVYMAGRQYDKALGELGGGGLDAFMLRLGDATTPFASRGDSLTTAVEVPKFFMLAKAQIETGHAADAKATFARLFANKRLGEIGEIHWLSLYERGRLAAEAGDQSGAVRDWQQAIEVIEEQRASINTEASKIGFVGDKQAVYQRLIDALFSEQRVAEAFAYLERSKSRALVDMLARQKDFTLPEANATRVRELLARADRAESAALEQSDAPAGRRTLDIVPVRREIAAAAPELASLVSVSSTPLAEIQARIPDDEALLEFYYYDAKTLFAFVLTREGLQGARLDAAGLDEDVRALRAAIGDPGTQAWRAPAQRLYARLIRPLEPQLKKNKLIVVAHGALHYLPFAALHDGSRFLADRYSVRFLPSASVLKYLRAGNTAKPAGILAFGNPDLGDAKYDLRFAQQEALSVVGTVPQSRALLRKDATEAALREYAGGFRYLHFATHGTFNAAAPLDSALLLAKDASSDGLLTVGKLYSLRLDADLVTLSACETGLGKITSGDDVIGLTRGFLYAGASTIVASLWQVDDQATSELMTRFYDNLKGHDKREALREAQLAMRGKFAHPYYWAAFQLIGNAQ